MKRLGPFLREYCTADEAMAYQPIENYGIIGNMRTAALVSMEGSIDWYCYPRFDSPSLFGAILDDKIGGQFTIQAIEVKSVSRKQFYWPDTNILITRFLTPDGIVEIEDFMPVDLDTNSIWYQSLLRRVRVVRGTVKLKLICRPSFDYARQNPVISLTKNGAIFRTPSLAMVLSNGGNPFKINLDNAIESEFILSEGEQKIFIFYELPLDQSCFPSPNNAEAEALFVQTTSYWRNWLSQCTYHGRWRENVYRSALVLKLLSYEPTGALIAAATCSLPEVIGGSRNWDYRYSWMRDAAFTVYGLLRIGFKKESEGFMKWLHSISTKTELNQPLQIVYGIDGRKDLKEEILAHLDGYRGSKPVRIGNGAYDQFQLDIYGEIMDAHYLFNKYVSPLSYDTWYRLRNRLNWICIHWKEPDRGIWEVRAGNQHFVYSKLMCWVALDRGIRLAEKRSFPADTLLWLNTRNQIYEDILNRGWNEKLGTFTQSYESQTLDASNLIMSLVFFMSPSDPRMLKTIDAMNRSPKLGGLVSDGLVYRYDLSQFKDGLTGDEGTFNMCSFWLVEALTRAGQTDRKRLEEARLLFERMLGYANHLGLYSEETSPEGRAVGNFPQAFTHMALISAAYNLDKVLGTAKDL